MRFIPIFVLLAHVSLAQLVFDIRNFGAVGDGSTVNTAAIQHAIDSASAVGGGEVLITIGTYKSSTIRLKSNVTLRIDTGATLLAMGAYNDFPDIPYSRPSWSDTYTKRSLIFAEHADNIRLTGGGTIDCGGYLNVSYLSIPVKQRPFGLRINECNNITIDSLSLQTAPQWMAHIMRCENVYIHHIYIFNHGFAANDGIDIDCCRNVLIENCVIDSNDDPLPIKTHSEDTCRDVLVRNCEFATFERAVKVGNESQGPLINVRFEDITVRETDFALKLPPQTAVYLAVADGGSADSISFERINVLTDYDTPIFIRLCNRGLHYDTLAPSPPVYFLRNVLVKDVTCPAKTVIPSSVTGIPGYNAENVRLENIHITAPGGGAGSSNIPEQISNRPENDIWGDSLPAYGLYVNHVNGLSLNNFCVDLESADSRSKYYFDDTADMKIAGACDVTSVTDNIIDEWSGIHVFPQPAHQTIRIEGIPQNEDVQLSVTNMLGQTVFVYYFNHPAGYADLDLSDYLPSLYVLSVKKGRQQHTARFMKE